MVTSNYTYEGDWVESAMQGNGVFTFSNGDNYIGQFVAGVFSGDGTYKSTGGWDYTGCWAEGVRSGVGKLTEGDTIWDGTFKGGHKNGQGVHTSPDGINFFGNEKYSLGKIQGTWVDGALTGQATSTYTNGICFTGEYLNNRKHGSGVLTVKDSYTYEGSFVEDKMDGKGRYTWQNGTYYDGEWKAGKMNG